MVEPNANALASAACDLANGAAQQLIPKIASMGTISGFDVDQTITLFASLSLQDYYSGNQTYAGLITSNMPAYSQSINFYGPNPFGVYNADSAYWSLAFVYAFRAYNNTLFLQLAKQAYDLTYESYITTTVAASGQGALRNSSIALGSSCKNNPLAGGVFQTRTPSNVVTISANSVGPFMAVSAYLSELEPQNQTYKDAAQLSLDFTTGSLWNGSIVQYLWDPTQCAYFGDTRTQPSAYFIEGLSVWANITASSTLTSFLANVVPSVATFPHWTNQNGIIFEGNGDETSGSSNKSVLIRALTEARNRNPGSDLASYIDTFITVQLNGLLAFSKAKDADLYTTAWVGGLQNTGILDSAGNLDAIDLLNAAFVIANSSNASSATGDGSPGSNVNGTGNDGLVTRRPSHTGAIVGGAVGGGAALIALGAIVFLYRRRQRHAQEVLRRDALDSPQFMSTRQAVIEPFLSPQTTPVLGTESRPSIEGSARLASKLGKMNAPYTDLMTLPHRPYAEPSGSSSGSQHDLSADDRASSSRPAVEQPVTQSAMEQDVPGLIAAVNSLNVQLHTLLQSQGASGSLHGNVDEQPPEYE